MLGSHGNPSRCGFRQPLPCLLLAIFFCLCPALLPGLFLPPSLLPVPAARACIPLPWCFPLLVSWYPLAPGAPVVSFIAACMITAPGRPPGGICRAYLQLLVYSPPGAHLLSCFASGVGRTVLFIAAYYLPVLLLASSECHPSTHHLARLLLVIAIRLLCLPDSSSGSGLLLCRTAARPSCLPAPVVFFIALHSFLCCALASASLLRACCPPRKKLSGHLPHSSCLPALGFQFRFWRLCVRVPACPW